MLKFTLPNFFEYFQINQFFIELNKIHPELFKEKINFIQVSGAFSYCSWTGGYNSNQGKGAYYPDFEKCYIASCLPLRLDFSNTLLENFDFYDAMGNIICKTNENGSNLISISNFDFMDFLHQKYPRFSFVLSRQADLILNFTTEILNSTEMQNQFKLIELPKRLTKNIEFLTQLKNRNKFEIIVNSTCPFSCPKLKDCALNEEQLQLSYSQQSNFRNCFKTQNYLNKNIISLEEIKINYEPLGFSHFTFDNFLLNEHPYEIFKFYLNYFIKPEKILEVQYLYENNGGKF